MVYYYLVEGENQNDGNALNKSVILRKKHTSAKSHILLHRTNPRRVQYALGFFLSTRMYYILLM